MRSEDGLEDDDDSVIDPDFQPLLEDLKFLPDFEEDITGDVDTIVEECERSQPIAGLSSADPGQQDSHSNKTFTNQKLKEKRKLQWKKKNLLLNDQQLRITGNTTLAPNLVT